MDDMTLFEDRFEERLRAFARTGVQSVDSAAVARAVAVGHPRSAATPPAVRRLGGEIHRPRQRVVFGPWKTRSIVRTALGAAAAVVLIVSGAVLFLARPGQPSIGGPSPTPTAGPSQSDAAAGPSASSSPTPTPLLWTQASLEEDWPAPVRLEPAGGAAIVTGLALDGDGHVRYPDRAGDVDASVPWIDIRELLISGSRTTLFIVLEANVTPVVDPTEQWIAYGVAWDTDRDGVADLRFGGDNPDGTDGRRVWITELHSGRTVVNPGGGYFEEAFYDKFFGVDGPSEGWGGARLKFGGDTTGGGIVGGMHSPFYAWASVIQDGRVVATDYAPDTGWLDPDPPAKP